MKGILVTLSLFLGFEAGASVCIAHRGDHSRTTENSLGAFKRAHQRGAEAIEFDIRHTRDGVAVVMHDPTLKRTARGNRCDIDSSIDSISSRNLRSRCELKNGENIPTLREVLNWHGSLSRPPILLIEFKDRPRRRTSSEIQRHFRRRPGDLRVISYNTSYLKRIRSFSSFFKNQVSMYPISNEARYVDRSFDGVAVQRPTASELSSFDFDLDVLVWTINDFSSYKKYDRLGVDYIATDQLGVCL